MVAAANHLLLSKPQPLQPLPLKRLHILISLYIAPPLGLLAGQYQPGQPYFTNPKHLSFELFFFYMFEKEHSYVIYINMLYNKRCYIRCYITSFVVNQSFFTLYRSNFIKKQSSLQTDIFVTLRILSIWQMALIH